MFMLAPPRPRRRPSLTPMIDVVFLLLIFFMLAARFGQEVTLPLGTAGSDGGTPWQGPPRLVEFAPGGALWLNGLPVSAQALPDALAPLTTAPTDPVILRPRGDASLQQIIDLGAALRAAGYTHLVLIEP